MAPVAVSAGRRASGVSASRRRGLPPVIASDARVLILGSFPSEASLAARRYYAHPRNHFWPILGAILGEPLPDLGYDDRLERVKRHRVAIWDTIASCERNGSLDSAIRNAERTGIRRVRRVAGGLKAVCFNGRTAARAEAAWAGSGYATLVLPSTSPAYTMPLERKLGEWRQLACWLDEER